MLRKHNPSAEFKIRCRVTHCIHFIIKFELFSYHFKYCSKVRVSEPKLKLPMCVFSKRCSWIKLEIEKRSVRSWYVSIGKLGCIQDSMPSNTLYTLHYK